MQFKSEGHLLAEFLLAQGKLVFDLLRPLTFVDLYETYTHPHYGQKSVLLKVHQFNDNLIGKKKITEAFRIMSEQTARHSGPANFTHKIVILGKAESYKF